ncbi:hypothetical protein V8G54_006903 [Vigna mungo]|uniref:AAA+ ATPase domain-containing protein n=1 Tax=Vigna mungo TaxID=3915 RepID=A0AAQ3P2G1_VIGMU
MLNFCGSYSFIRVLFSFVSWDDAELVKEIVNEVLKRLVKQSINTKGLVGIDEKIAAIESLIREEPEQTRLIGIWGMGGVGKTTLAEEVFNKLQSEYEGSYFVASETDRSNKHELISLKEKIDNSVAFELGRLKDKALITISDDNTVSIHDSLQEMAWEIVRQESVEHPGNRSRLWELNDICEALKNDKVKEAIRSIRIHLPTIKEQKLVPQILEINMSKLKFLEVFVCDRYDELTLLKGPQFLATELRFLSWYQYPLKSLPENFSAEKLVILKLRNGKMEKLWDGVKNMVNLKQVDLSRSQNLKKLPDLSKATNLEVLLLMSCSSLTSVHPSIFSLPKLVKLDLLCCTSLTTLGSSSSSCNLSFLNLGRCTNLRKFLLISENIKKLRLGNTMVKELPSSISNFNQLLHLDISFCSKLRTIPKLPLSLETLKARECQSLKTILFPSTAVEQLKENRKEIRFWKCMNLDNQTLVGIGLNVQINVMNYANQHISTASHNHVEHCDDDNCDSYSGVYVYPGSRVPKWLEYKTRKDSIIIDLSSAPPSPLIGFIFCFVLGEYHNADVDRFEVVITIDGEDEGNSISVPIYIDYGYEKTESDHVCVINDADLLKAIVDLVLRRLTKSLVNSKGLVGIDKRIADVESLIHRESEKARLIGLWGMGGIGKTTLAEEVYNKLRSKYEGCYFLANVREQLSREGKICLRKEIFSALLGDVKIDTPNSLPEYIVRRISQMKVLIVLDDVNDSDHIGDLLGALDNFGSGSCIIVTTRDEQVLKANKTDEIYHLREFTSDEALELFNLNAFNQRVHQREYDELSKRIVHYAKGLPLILKVLAHRLHGKNEEVWESELDKLKNVPPTKVYDVIKLSYDDLDRKEKNIFLDLACFFCTSFVKITTDYLKYLLKDGERDNSVVVSLERLKDKALITFSQDNVVCMHDSIKEMAWEIVRQESPEDPGNRSRLWDPDDIYEAFKNDKVNEAIRSIRINSVLLRWQECVPHIAKMSRLRFVEIYGADFSRCRQLSAEGQGLQFWGTEIRFLSWVCYPLKSLPDKFSGEKLVILKLELGRMEKLWDGVKNLVNLKQLDLTDSHSLKELPDLSKAKNIEVLCLGSCSGLTRLPSSFANHTQLLYLDISHCPKILTIPELPLSLETLYAGSCKSLKTVLFHSTAVEQTKENRKQVLFDGCMNLDEPSLEAIGLNVRINVMKFANQHLSAPKQDDFQNYNDYDKNFYSYQAFYGYPGSSIPEWLEYKSKKYSVIIDLSSAPPSPVYGFILCFVLLGEVDKIRFNIVISDCEGKGVMERFRMKLFRNTWRSIESQKVVVMYDQRCSNFLNNIAKRLTRFKIMVRRATKDDGSFYSKRIMVGLSGFGLKTPTNEGCVPSPACQTAETIGYISCRETCNFDIEKWQNGQILGWSENMMNLKQVDLSRSQNLKRLPDQSKATNLEMFTCTQEVEFQSGYKTRKDSIIIDLSSAPLSPLIGKYHNTDVDRFEVMITIEGEDEGKSITVPIYIDYGNDADLLKAIVDLVLRRLTKSLVNSKGLVGIDKRIADVESLIHRESEKARLIGLWGMGGIGKTTLAEEVYNKLQFKYEGCYFLANVREQLSRDGKICLRKEIFSALLGDVKIDTPNSLPESIVRRIRRMKVLIVLDDVNDSDHIEDLLGILDNFRSGSSIIVTTRDEQVLKANKADEIYHLREFTSNEALELFNLNAFNQSVHQRQYNKLSKRIVQYAKGLPLILKVLAHRLYGKNEEIWESELDKLKKMPPTKVYDVIKLSYDDLDRKEKQIFLDLACFFCISFQKITIGYLKYLLKDGERDNSVVVSLERLKDKALITFSQDNVVYIHDSIKEMAWEIVRQESPEDPGNRSRLWAMDDIYEAFKNDKVSEATRSIQINLVLLPWPEFVSHIAKMSRLRFVEINGADFSHCRQLSAEGQGLQFWGTEIRFLSWVCYPLKSLPDKFSGEKLVILKLKVGRMEKLWDGVKNLVNLKQLDLTDSYSLKELPDLSKATNIEVLRLVCCVRLTRLPSSFASNTQLLHLNVTGCEEIRTIPELPLSLQTLHARNCVSLKTVLFNSTAVEQTKENRKQVLFAGCKNLDEPSLEAIGLNARINVMKFANQHLSAPKQDDFQNYNDYEKNYDSYQAFYEYPGSSVPEWLEYKSKKNSVIIDLSSAPPSPVYGFILCFVPFEDVYDIEFNIVISDCEGKGITDRVRMKLNHGFAFVRLPKVVVMYDQRCSDFLNNIATSLTRFEIMAWQRRGIGIPCSLSSSIFQLRGFGVSIIRTWTYSSFMQQIKEARWLILIAFLDVRIRYDCCVQLLIFPYMHLSMQVDHTTSI